eukprot:TRINITY_DN76_c0_g1_i3.p3 TRINITY_DN76_c0_g1~~TRINITY_DN76_c0_g1_i3.p3  ORF type:complete len:161 (-),score=15.88 TRINITY_DN76_c0_g1_i3:365-847(-)
MTNYQVALIQYLFSNYRFKKLISIPFINFAKMLSSKMSVAPLVKKYASLPTLPLRSNTCTMIVKMSHEIHAHTQTRIQAQTKIQVIKAALIGTPVLSVTMPALAIVDERMNGDGVGYSLGFNEPVLFWVVLGMFSLVWALYFSSQSELGGDEDDEAGLSL